MAGGRASAAEPATRWVLGADAAPTVKAIGATLVAHTELRLVRIAIDRDQATFHFDGATVALRHGGDGIPTRQGVLAGDLTDFGDLEALRRAVDGVDPPLAWQQVTTPPPQVDYVIDEVAAKGVSRARKRILALRQGHPDPGPAAGSEAPPTPRVADERILDVARGPYDPAAARALLREHPMSPKAWAAAALAAKRAGRPHEALTYADVATRLGTPDADAFGVWSDLTGREPTVPGDAVPAVLGAGANDGAPAPGGLWWLLAGLLGFLAVATRAGEGHYALGFAGVVAMFGLGGAAAAEHRTVPPLANASVPLALVAPLAGGPCEAAPALRATDRYEILARCEGEPVTFVVTFGPGPRVHVRTRAPHDEPVVVAATRHLQTLLRNAMTAGDNLRPPAAGAPASSSRLSASDQQERTVAAALAAASVPALLLLHLVVIAGIVVRLRERRHERWLFAGLALASLLIHVLAPSRLVMEYTGYDLTARLAGLEDLPRYGAGTIWAYAPWFRALGTDHATLQLANRVFGFATLIPIFWLAVRTTRWSRWAPYVVGALFVALPVVWRDHVSEGMHAATLWVLAWGLVAAVSALKSRRPSALRAVAAGVVLAWAVTCRPEVAFALVPLGIVAIVLTWGRKRWLAVALVAGVALASVPHLVWLVQSATRQIADTGIEAPAWQQALEALTVRNLFVLDWWVPWSVPLWALLALALARGRRLEAFGWIAAAGVWIAVTSVDLPAVSIPRVHLPAVLLLLPAVAIGFAKAQEVAPRINAVLLLLVPASVILTAPRVVEPGLQEVEDGLIRAAATELDGRGCLARVGFDDPPQTTITPRHFPHYLTPGVAVTSLHGLRRHFWQECDGRAVVVLGTRCYAMMRDPDQPAPEEPAPLPVCRSMFDRYELEPLIQKNVPTQTVGTFPMYPAKGPLTVGVYRVRAPR